MEIVSNARSKFNWDDIEVGNDQLDHSQNFFAQKHIKHEKLSDLDFINNQMASAGIDDADNTITDLDFDVENKENALSASPLLQENRRQPAVNTAKTLEDNDKASVLAATNHKEIKVDYEEEAHVDDEPQHTLDVTAKPSKPPANIATQWSTRKVVVSKVAIAHTAAAKSVPPPPHAYEFKDLYEKKKQEALRRREEEDRKMRQFHSRPAPNFSAHHEQLARKKVVHMVTAAVTPMVLKKSRETEEKRKKKLEEWKRKQQPLKFEPREANVLKEEPFVPKKMPTVIKSCPFNLRMERRLQERKQYNEEAHRALEEKNKQVQNEEEERKKREEERVRELRQKATFKARPNPFK